MSTWGKVDLNQPTIVAGLERSGYLVALTSMVRDGFPDIVVRSKSGIVVLIEIKSLTKPLSPAENTFHDLWTDCPVHVARSFEQALEIMEFYDNQRIFVIPICHRSVPKVVRERIVGQGQINRRNSNKSTQQNRKTKPVPTRPDRKNGTRLRSNFRKDKV